MFKKLEIMILKHLGILDYYERTEKFSFDVLETLREIAEKSNEKEAHVLKEFTIVVAGYIQNGDHISNVTYECLGDYKTRPDLITKLFLRKIIGIKPSI